MIHQKREIIHGNKNNDSNDVLIYITFRVQVATTLAESISEILLKHH